MKKIKMILLGIIAILSITLITACDNDNGGNKQNNEHTTHDYTIQKSNESKHWNECGCGAKSAEEEHKWTEWNNTKEPTEETTGIKERECSICHYKETETIQVLGHIHKYSTEWTIDKEATCTEAGSKSHHCLSCEDKIDITEIPMINHNYSTEWIIDKEATCTVMGSKSHHCLSCEEKKDVTVIELLEHSFGEWKVIIEATEEAEGLKEKQCSVCHHKESEKIPMIENITGLKFAFDYDSKGYSVIGIGTAKALNITIPSTYNNLPVKRIGYRAFMACSSLTNVTISNSVTSIGYSAFEGCRSLESIVIPDSVTSIGYSAFEGCRSLENVYYEGTIENWCNISFGSYLASNPMYYANHFYLRNSNNEWEEVTSIEIPNSITEIGNYQFHGFSNVTSITIPDNVISIGENAFRYCSSLTNIVIPNSIASIGTYAFYACEKLVEVYNLSLINISISSEENGYVGYYAKIIHTSLEEKSNLIEKDCYVFIKDNENKYYLVRYKGNDTELFLPSNIEDSAYEINQYAFYYCSTLESITIPESVTSIGYSAFQGCSRLTNVTIGNSVTSIGENAFRYCSSLTNVTIGNSVTSIGKSAFAQCSNLASIMIPDSVTKIGNEAFYSCNRLKKVIIGHGVTSIGTYAFYLCHRLVEAYNLSSYTSIGALVNHTSLEEESGLIEKDNYIFIRDKNNQYYLVDYNGTDSQIVLPNDIEGNMYVINEYAFYEYSSLESIVIPDSVISIGGSAFLGCSSLKYNEYDNGLYIGNSENPYLWLIKVKATNITSCEINSNTRFIYGLAFSGCRSLESIVIPDSVTSIGYSAFEGCRSLESIVIPDSVTSIGYSAFEGCSSLKYNEYDNGLYIGNSENPYLWLIKVKATNITSCEINSNTRFIYGLAFFGCSSLESIVIPNSVINIGGSAFWNCSSLESIVIPDSVINIGGSTFYNCSSLTNVTIGNSVTSIGQLTFWNCSSLTNVTIGNSVTSMETDAFYSCDKLTNVYYEGTIEDWCKIKFSDFTSNPMKYASHFYIRNSNNEWEEVTSIEIPDTITKIGNHQFCGFRNVTSLTIPNCVTIIEDRAFSNCSSLTNVTIGNSIRSIGTEAFYSYNNLGNVYYEGTIEDWCKIKFSDFTSNPMYSASHFFLKNSNNEWEELTSIEIPDTITEIGCYQFSGFINVTSITIPNSVTIIEDRAFYNCSNLKVYYKGDSIEWNNISNSYLTSVTIYYYSETQPTEKGNYWHYVDGVPTKWQ